MSFWRDLVGDIKRLAVLHDDVRHLGNDVERLTDRVASQGERIATLEGIVGWVRSDPPGPPRIRG